MMIHIYNEIIKLQNQGQAGILVTVIDKQGHSPAAVGKKMLVTEQGLSCGTIGGGELELLVIKKSQQLLDLRQNHLEHISLDGETPNNPGGINMLCGGFITLFYEYLPVRPAVYIFGAGHIGSALAHYLQFLDFTPIVIDTRAELIAALPPVHKVLVPEYADIFSREKIHPPGYIVIASYSHAEDYDILKAIYQSDWQPLYIGLVASRKKSRIMVERLKSEITADLNLTYLYSPAGLDIGGKSPGEIALSILAEIHSIHYRKENLPHLTKI